MTEQESSEPTPQVERWVFGGTRVDKAGRRVHCWIPPEHVSDDEPAEWVFRARGQFSVGSVYEATVTRHDDGRVIKHGDPRYTGERAAEELRDRLAARHRAAEVRLDLVARERRDKRNDPLERAIERLSELAGTVPASQRTGLAVYVATRLMRSWR